MRPVRVAIGLTIVAAPLMSVLVLAPMMMVAGFGATTTGTTDQPASCDAGAPAGHLVRLDAAQKRNARTIIETGVSLKIPTRGLIVSIATALQESTLRNIGWGDADSVGLFQQRPPWGSFAERTDPETSATLFFTGGRGGQPGLLDISGWESMSVTGAAQAVQRSAFPTAYAKWEGDAVSLVAQFTDPEPCTPDAPAGACTVTDLTGYANGQIPDSALCPLPFASGHRLRGDAANAAVQLATAYKQHFGTTLCVTDSYRSLAAQIDVYRRKPDLAARPGTSNHGWGVALDLCGGLQTAGSAEDAWLHQNGGRFGWVHPAWAEPGGSKPEPWHWEYERS